jgi:hypothetical protein
VAVELEGRVQAWVCGRAVVHSDRYLGRELF